MPFALALRLRRSMTASILIRNPSGSPSIQSEVAAKSSQSVKSVARASLRLGSAPTSVSWWGTSISTVRVSTAWPRCGTCPDARAGGARGGRALPPRGGSGLVAAPASEAGQVRSPRISRVCDPDRPSGARGGHRLVSDRSASHAALLFRRVRRPQGLSSRDGSQEGSAFSWDVVPRRLRLRRRCSRRPDGDGRRALAKSCGTPSPRSYRPKLTWALSRSRLGRGSTSVLERPCHCHAGQRDANGMLLEGTFDETLGFRPYVPISKSIPDGVMF